MNVTKKDKSNQSEAARLYEMSSEKNRNLFLFYLATITYILITAVSTTDLDLLLSEKFLILPVLTVGIPLIFFYLSSSLLVLILHFSLLHNTTEHLKKIKQWEKEEENKNRESISSHLMHPYIFDFAYLSPLGRLDNILIYSASFLLYFLAPFCLFYIQFRFSDYQDLLYSFWHFICLSADLYFLILFFNADHNPSRKKLLFLNVAHSSNRKKQDLNDSTSVAEFFGFFKYIGKLLKYFTVNPITSTGKLLKYFMVNPITSTGKFLKYFMVNLIKDTGKLYKEGRKRFVMIIVFFFLGFLNLGIVGMLQFDRSITLLEKLDEFALRIAMPLKITILSNFTMPIGKLLDEFIAPKITIPPGTRIQKQNLEDIKLIAIQNSTNEKKAWEVHGENYDLSYRRLVFSDFSGSYMQKIVLKEAYLQRSRMLRTHLQGADMWYAQMQGADMNNAELQGADMNNAELQGANMNNAKLRSANMSRAKLQGANMSNTQLKDANMSSTQLQGANMRNAKLREAGMRNAQLQEADMRGADMSKAELQGANMSNAQFQGADMSKAELQGANMSNAQFQGADMRNAKLQGTNMNKAQFQGADMSNAQFQGADMSNAQFQGANMSNAQFQGANMSSVQLQGANMSSAQLQGANMSNAQLQGANIQEAKFSGTNIEKANLRGSFCREKRYDGFLIESILA